MFRIIDGQNYFKMVGTTDDIAPFLPTPSLAATS
jgi:hypothetical protein